MKPWTLNEFDMKVWVFTSPERFRASLRWRRWIITGTSIGRRVWALGSWWTHSGSRLTHHNMHVPIVSIQNCVPAHSWSSHGDTNRPTPKYIHHEYSKLVDLIVNVRWQDVARRCFHVSNLGSLALRFARLYSMQSDDSALQKAEAVGLRLATWPGAGVGGSIEVQRKNKLDGDEMGWGCMTHESLEDTGTRFTVDAYLMGDFFVSVSVVWRLLLISSLIYITFVFSWQRFVQFDLRMFFWWGWTHSPLWHHKLKHLAVDSDPCCENKMLQYLEEHRGQWRPRGGLTMGHDPKTTDQQKLAIFCNSVSVSFLFMVSYSF